MQHNIRFDSIPTPKFEDNEETREWGVWSLLPISAVGWSISGYGKGMLGVLKGCEVLRMARWKELVKGWGEVLIA
jgi:hypothetical protein